MATSPVLCKGVDSSNNVLPVSLSSTGEVQIASASSLTVAGSVSVSNFPATQAVSAASLPLPSGAATSALQGTANTSLGTIAGDTTSLDSKTPALGQAAKSASVPVVIASDQGTITVSSTQSATSSSDSLTITSGSTDTSVSKDTAGYSKIGVVLESNKTDTEAQIKWSHDDVTYYAVESKQVVTSTSEIGGGASVNSLYFIVSPIAKYVRLDIKATTAASVKALVNLH